MYFDSEVKARREIAVTMLDRSVFVFQGQVWSVVWDYWSCRVVVPATGVVGQVDLAGAL